MLQQLLPASLHHHHLNLQCHRHLEKYWMAFGLPPDAHLVPNQIVQSFTSLRNGKSSMWAGGMKSGHCNRSIVIPRDISVVLHISRSTASSWSFNNAWNATSKSSGKEVV